MPRLFFAVPRRLKTVILVLAVLPCMPGFTILLAGWLRDPARHSEGRNSTAPAELQRAVEQTRGLYRAGSVALGMGGLCGLATLWTVMRQREAEDEEDESPD